MPLDAEVVRLIVLEDNAPDVLLVEECLKNLSIDYELTHFSDGHKALEAMKEGVWHRVRPHAILLDLNVPKVTGMEVLAKVKEDDALRDVPVVVLTSSMAPEERDAAQSLGAAIYVAKPVDLDDFFNEVGGALRSAVYGEGGVH